MPRCADCEDLLKSVTPQLGAWMKQRFGHEEVAHWAKRGDISAAVDVQPHYLTLCGLSLGEMVLVEQDWRDDEANVGPGGGE